jgi:hypothetical protein
MQSSTDPRQSTKRSNDDNSNTAPNKRQKKDNNNGSNSMYWHNYQPKDSNPQNQHQHHFTLPFNQQTEAKSTNKSSQQNNQLGYTEVVSENNSIVDSTSTIFSNHSNTPVMNYHYYEPSILSNTHNSSPVNEYQKSFDAVIIENKDLKKQLKEMQEKIDQAQHQKIELEKNSEREKNQIESEKKIVIGHLFDLQAEHITLSKKFSDLQTNHLNLINNFNRQKTELKQLQQDIALKKQHTQSPQNQNMTEMNILKTLASSQADTNKQLQSMYDNKTIELIQEKNNNLRLTQELEQLKQQFTNTINQSQPNSHFINNNVTVTISDSYNSSSYPTITPQLQNYYQPNQNEYYSYNNSAQNSEIDYSSSEYPYNSHQTLETSTPYDYHNHTNPITIQASNETETNIPLPLGQFGIFQNNFPKTTANNFLYNNSYSQ